MTNGRWERLCVVGIGKHASTKLIPAIVANGQQLAGLVTRKDPYGNLGHRVPHFGTVGEAVAALPSDTAFVIASPPAIHFDQVMTALWAGHDTLVEKPAFVTAAQARAAADAARASGALLVEGFMNRHTATHRRFLRDFAKFSPMQLNFTFTIPQAPPGTFRTESAIGASNLYDMGCYLLGTLCDAGLDLESLELKSVEQSGQPERELLHLEGTLHGVAVRALIGVDMKYVNRLELTAKEGLLIAYSPFIYGRPGLRVVTSRRGEEQIEECNAFETMLAVPREVWRASQTRRSNQIVDIAAHLERLGRSLESARKAD